MRIVIIEDEELTARDLSEYLTQLVPGCGIITVLPSVKKAKAFFLKQDNYDLVFSDIQLGDGLCFQIFEEVPVKAPIIFCTAYDDYILEAFKTNGIAYILKPFDKEIIAGALSKFQYLKTIFQNDNSIYTGLLEKLAAKSNGIQTILVYQKNKIIPVNTEEIALFYILAGEVKIVTFNGKQFDINKTLEEIEKLNLSHFFRANRQFLVQRKAVNEVALHSGQKLLLRLHIPFSEQIVISKERHTIFLKWLSET